MALAGREGEEPVQPGHEHGSGRLAVDTLGGLADGVDLVGVEGLEKLSAAGEVAVQRRHADAGRRETSAIDTSASGSAKAERAAARILSRLRSASARLVSEGNWSGGIGNLSGQAIR